MDDVAIYPEYLAMNRNTKTNADAKRPWYTPTTQSHFRQQTRTLGVQSMAEIIAIL